MIWIPEPPESAVAAEEPPATEQREPNMSIVAAILAVRIGGIGRGGLARDIAQDLEAHAARSPAHLALEYRRAAELLREEAETREVQCQAADNAVRSASGMRS